MDIQNKTILVLGGWGLVGSAVCRKFMEEHSSEFKRKGDAKPSESDPDD